MIAGKVEDVMKKNLLALLLLFALVAASLSGFSGCASYCRQTYDCASAETSTVYFDLTTKVTQTATVAPGKKFVVVLYNTVPGYKYSPNFTTNTPETTAIILSKVGATPALTSAQINSTLEASKANLPSSLAGDIEGLKNKSLIQIENTLNELQSKNEGTIAESIGIVRNKFKQCPHNTVTDYKDLVSKLLDSQADESAISEVQRVAYKFINDPDNADRCTLYIDNIQKLMSRTTTTLLYPNAVKAGQEISLEITRGALSTNGTGTVPKTWLFNVTSGPAPEWRITYGFAMLRNYDQLYSARSIGANQFVVQRSNKSSDASYNALPVLMFSWYDPVNDARGWDWGPTAGLGLDFTNPTVLVGFQYNYHQNIFLGIGAAMTKQERLKSTYSNGQVLTTQVQDADLVEQKYGPTWYFALTIRFNSNPFDASSSQNSSSSTKK
jgi:hypothetical protein